MVKNTYFQFKQFRINQERCAMKVCTDACLFGALLPVGHTPVLDIGTGTGILSLMLAQQDPQVMIEALEIDEAAAIQARENVEASPWGARLNVIHQDVSTFAPAKKYGLIISNPPFYEGDLRSADTQKNKAKHDASLTLKRLAELSAQWLAPGGILALLLPFHRVEYFENLARDENLFLQKKIHVRQTPKHGYFRGILFFGHAETKVEIAEILIREEDGKYSRDFAKLLEPFYLNTL